MILRPYQLQAINNLRTKLIEGKKRLLLVSPTGSGKTCIAAEIVRLSLARGKRVLFLAHRRELIDQASRKLSALDIKHGIIMAGTKPTDAPVQVASVQTLIRRDLPPADITICDEAHHSVSESYQKLMPGVVIGLTATPFRVDGRGLGQVFDDLVRVATVDELVAGGFLVPAKVWAPTAVNMAGAARRAGDFAEEDAAAAVDRREVTGDVVRHYLKLAAPRKAVCFAVNVKHSQNLCAAFLAAGINAVHLDAETPLLDRERILRDPAVRVICNCGILSEGWDSPEFSVCIQARPTASLSLHLQQIGRVLRPHPDKRHAIVLDHAGNTLRLGLANENHEVSLEKGLIHRRKEEATPTVYQCVKCYACFLRGAGSCPCCGEPVPVKERKIRTSGGILEEIGTCKYCGSAELEKRPHEIHGTGVWCSSCGRHLLWLGKNVTPEEYYRKQVALCREKGWKTGRAGIMFQNRYGRWPTRAEQDAAA